MTKYSPSIKAPSEVAVAYTAGLFDGVGTFDPERFRINISNTDKQVVDWLQDKWGGGSVSKLSKKDFYFWALTSLMDAKLFLETVSPYLTKRRKQASQILDAIEKKIAG